MSLIKRLYELVIIGSIKNTETVPDVDAWNSFLSELPNPIDEVDESYNKYRCRRYFISGFRRFILNAAALVGLMRGLPCYLTKTRVPKDINQELLLLVRDTAVAYDDILPNELTSKFKHMDVVAATKRFDGSMTHEGKILFRKVLQRHPFSFYYLLLVMKEISNHSRYMEEYGAQTTAVYVNERNVASPLIRRLYEERGCCYDSFMHGEYLYQLIQGFMSFSHFYVWAGSYADMFADDLRCNCGEYIVYTPRKLQKKWNLQEVKNDHFCTYYFSGESTTSIKKLSQLFKELEGNGLHCVVRPHPRHSHLDLISQEFPAEMIEDARSVSIKDSLGSAEYIVGLSSTVLFEAKAEGKKVVIDDFSNPDIFRNLQKRKFRLLNEEHLLLSEVIRGICCD